jgi:uncharacterized protein
VRVFLDTNVLVSAFSARGLCSDLLLLVIEEHELLTGEIVLAELRSVLHRKFRVPGEMIEQVEAFLREYPVEPLPPTKELPKLQLTDRNDLFVVASALNSRAEVLVTGDTEMRTVSDVRTRIVSPREFWTLAKRAKSKASFRGV